MAVAGYDVLVFVHILLFAYWLGADLGVFYGARMAAKPGLTYQERIKIRHVVMVVDMAPRTALILMLPVGFQLASNWVTTLSGTLLFIWVASLVWLTLMWAVHLTGGTDLGEVLRRIDLTVRYVLMVFLFCLGLYSLLANSPMEPNWLAAKVLLFGLVIAAGIGLRYFAARNPPIFEDLRLEQNVPEAEQRLDANRKAGARVALLLWTLVAVMAFLGSTKPF